MKTCCLFLLVLLAACDATEPTAPTSAELARSACEDLEAAHLAMCQRCGLTPPLPASSPGAAWKYADCSKATTVRDLDALYATCLPALEAGCYDGDTPAALGCHQIEF